MLEIVFNDSARVSLMMAQNYGDGPYKQGQAALLFAGEIDEDGNDIPVTEEELETFSQEWEAEEKAKWEASKPLGGSKTDVFGFELHLSRGDISESGIGEKRQQVLQSIADQYHDEENLVDYTIKKMKERLEVLCSRIQQGELVRIWYGDNPDQLCSMLWLANEICSRGLPRDQIHIIKVPEWKVEHWRGVVFSSGVRALGEEQWHTYLNLQQKVPADLIEQWAKQWNVLQKEASLLRAILNGMVVSVAEDFYDPFILKAMETMEDKFKEFSIIVPLYDMNLGIDDAWISHRLDRFIEEGKLRVVAIDRELPDQRILKKI